MRTRFMEHSDINRLSEFDPTPRYIVATLRRNWVWGLIRRRSDETSELQFTSLKLHKLSAH